MKLRLPRFLASGVLYLYRNNTTNMGIGLYNEKYQTSENLVSLENAFAFDTNDACLTFDQREDAMMCLRLLMQLYIKDR